MKKRISMNCNLLLKLVNKATSKLVSKLILLFATIIIAIVVSLTFISYKITQDESVKNIISSNNNNLKLVNKNFEKYFKEVGQSSFPFNNYDNFMNAVSHEEEDYTQRVYIENYLRDLISQRKDINSLYLYIPQYKKYYYTKISNNDLTIKTIYNKDLSQLDWYKRLMESPINSYIQSLTRSEKIGYPIEGHNQFIMFHRVFRKIADKQPMAVISFCVNSLNRDEILKDIPTSEDEHTILLNDSNKLFYGDRGNYLKIIKDRTFLDRLDENLNNKHFYWKINGKKYLVIYDTSSVDNWKLIKLILYSQINKVAKMNSNINLLTGGIFLILSVALVMVTSKSITSPLNKLSKKMNAFGKGDLDMHIDIRGRDEIAQLSRQFNDMVIKINELINEQYKMKLVQKNAILKALEAELNPHFLYNALQAISTEALKSGAEEVCVMVDALAFTFRYCINGVEIVKVRDEIKHVENYLIIQKARYGNRLQVVYDLEDSALDFEIPKLSIQSLVENSIKHALEERSTVSTILIKVVVDGLNAKIMVKDNGPGIKMDRLVEIIESLNSEWTDGDYKCIGLKNLNTRLKLIFGEKSEIIIVSDETGTQTSIIIPERSHA